MRKKLNIHIRLYRKSSAVYGTQPQNAADQIPKQLKDALKKIQFFFCNTEKNQVTPPKKQNLKKKNVKNDSTVANSYTAIGFDQKIIFSLKDLTEVELTDETS